jgi:hypothetical protein
VDQTKIEHRPALNERDTARLKRIAEQVRDLLRNAAPDEVVVVDHTGDAPTLTRGKRPRYVTDELAKLRAKGLVK